jgi:thiol-disulfide isomerase/thioredoxin
VRLELRPWPARDAWVIAASSAPISVTDEVAWLDLEPDGLPRVVPRKPPKVTHKHWRGTGCTLSARLAVDGKPLAGHRATLWLLDNRGAGQSTLTARADKAGVVRWSLPRQHFRAAGLRASGGGAGRDLYFAARWRGGAVDVGCEAGGDVAIDLTLAKRDKASKHTRASAPSPWVGRALPTLDVRRWHGLDEPLPADLHGKVMILYLWATWCGPCRSTSPRVSELHARLADEGVIVVKGSVDKSGTALEDHLRDRLPGAAPVAWLGPDALGALEVRGIPTTFLIDGDGVVRRVHRGSGLDIEAWQDDARALIAGKPLAVRPPAGKGAAKHPPATTAPATKRSKRP